MMRRPHNPEFGTAVRQELDQRGLSLRSQRRYTGINHMSMHEWVSGFPPAHIDQILVFCRAFGLPANEWLELAGFEPIWNPHEMFNERIRLLAEEEGEEILISASDLQLANATPEQVEQAVAAVRERHRDRKLGRRKGRGGSSAPGAG